MAGLASGALYGNKIFRKISPESYMKVQFSVALYSLILPFLILGLKTYNLPVSFVYMIFFLLTLTISFLTGTQFSIASGLQKDSIANVSAGIYSVDLLGSAIGALLVAVLLFPMLGLVKVCVLLFLINLGAGMLSFWGGERSG